MWVQAAPYSWKLIGSLWPAASLVGLKRLSKEQYFTKIEGVELLILFQIIRGGNNASEESG